MLTILILLCKTNMTYRYISLDQIWILILVCPSKIISKQLQKGHKIWARSDPGPVANITLKQIIRDQEVKYSHVFLNLQKVEGSQILSSKWPRASWKGQIDEDKRVKAPTYINHDYNHIILVQLSLSKGSIVASFYKALYGDYLCMVASNKQLERSQRNNKKILRNWHYLSWWTFVLNIVQQLLTPYRRLTWS